MGLCFIVLWRRLAALPKPPRCFVRTFVQPHTLPLILWFVTCITCFFVIEIFFPYVGQIWNFRAWKILAIRIAKLLWNGRGHIVSGIMNITLLWKVSKKLSEFDFSDFDLGKKIDEMIFSGQYSFSLFIEKKCSAADFSGIFYFINQYFVSLYRPDSLFH